MFPSLLTTTSLLASLALLIVAITNCQLTYHSSTTLAFFFPAKEYAWLGAPGSKEHYDIVYRGEEASHKVFLTYDGKSEYAVWVSCGVGILAGMSGLVGWGVGCKVCCSIVSLSKCHLLPSSRQHLLILYDDILTTPPTQTPRFSPLSTILTLSLAILTLLTSLVSLIYTSAHRANLQRSTCHVDDSKRDPNTVFRCSRELVACKLLPFIADTNWADNARMCRETTASRMLLVAFAGLAAVLVGVGGMGWVARRRAVGHKVATDDADEAEN
jgi:hypothetical protein